jgi:hypothetical protein
MNLPSFSRASHGKCTETLKAMVPYDLKSDFIAKARSLGYASESDCLREMVQVFVHGHEAVAKVHAERLKRLAGTVQDPDT